MTVCGSRGSGDDASEDEVPGSDDSGAGIAVLPQEQIIIRRSVAREAVKLLIKVLCLISQFCATEAVSFSERRNCPIPSSAFSM